MNFKSVVFDGFHAAADIPQCFIEDGLGAAENRRAHPPSACRQCVEIGDAVDAKDDGLAVDDELLVPVLQGAFDDPGKAAGPVIAALSDQPDAIAVTLDAKA